MDWPLGEKDLAVEDVVPLATQPFGYQALVRQRSGGRKYLYGNYEKKGGVDKSSFNGRDFGQNSLALGVAVIGKDVFVPVLRASGASNSFLELRNLTTNVVFFKSQPIGAMPTQGRVVQVKNGIWLDLSVSDTSQIILFLTKKNGKYSLERIDRNQGNTNPLVVTGEASKSYSVFPPASPNPTDGKVTFRLAINDPAEKKSDIQSLSMNLSENLESWSAAGGDRVAWIAYVDGDSLIGKGTLRISSLRADNDSFEEKVNKEIPLKTSHLSEPYLLGLRDRALVMMVRWLDKDSVLSLYQVSGNQVKHVGDFGTLEAGSRIAGAFYDAESGELNLAVRAKHEHFWDYKVCQIGVDL